MKKNLFDSVVRHARAIKMLESVLDLITWDQETIMPPASSQHRGEQRALLSGMIHTQKNDPHFIESLFTLAEQGGDTDDDSILIKRLSKDIEKARKLPVMFVKTFTQVTSDGFSAWSRAREENDFSAFQPHLERIVDLVRQKAELLGYSEQPYDALLDLYEPETTARDIDTLFASFRPKLLDLLEEIKSSPFYSRKPTVIESTSSQQIDVCRSLVTLIGFDWTKGRMDTSDHPFSTGIHPTDTRITVRRHSDDILDQVMSALHETGHSFYEAGLSTEWYGTPLAEPASYGIHESQSRFWETVVGRSRIFVPHILRALQSVVGASRLPFQSAEELYVDLNHVECSLIRTNADEATYPLHVMLRYEIEKELLEGSLAVKDLPTRWNDGMEAFLGIRPKDNREGCLQDVHWAFGNIGYFPTYTLGSLYAIAFYTAMSKSIPQIEEYIGRGHFEPIRTWLHDHVWCHGRRFLGKELVTKALQRTPTDDDYISYLRNKFISES